MATKLKECPIKICPHTLLPPECTNEVLSKLRNPQKCPVPTPEPKDISPSSTTPWPTSKTVYDLVHFMLYHRPILFIFILPYISTIQLLGCCSCNKRLSSLVFVMFKWQQLFKSNYYSTWTALDNLNSLPFWLTRSGNLDSPASAAFRLLEHSILFTFF